MPRSKSENFAEKAIFETSSLRLSKEAVLFPFRRVLVNVVTIVHGGITNVVKRIT